MCTAPNTGRSSHRGTALFLGCCSSVSGGHTKHQPLPQAATQAFVACGLSRVGPRRAGTGEPTACVLGVEELREGDEYELVREEGEVAEENAVLAAGCQWHEFWWEHP